LRSSISISNLNKPTTCTKIFNGIINKDLDLNLLIQNYEFLINVFTFEICFEFIYSWLIKVSTLSKNIGHQMQTFKMKMNDGGTPFMLYNLN